MSEDFLAQDFIECIPENLCERKHWLKLSHAYN